MELEKCFDQKVKITGFVDSIRSQKKRYFLILRDVSCKVQVYYEKGISDQIDQILDVLTVESVVEIEGIVTKNDYVKFRGFEVVMSNITIISAAQTPLPIDNTAPMQDRLDWRFLDLRRNNNLLLFQVQTLVEQAMREFWQKHNFIEIHSPKLMGAPSESGAELFELKYFEKTAYLAQSPQFYKQMAIAAGFENIFEIGPVFRANPSFTSRHDTEFTSVDMEIAWIESHEDVMEFEERWIQFILTRIKDVFGEKIQEAFDVDVNIPQIPFPRVTMEEACEIVTKKGHVIDLEYTGELDPKGEKVLSQYFQESLGHEFVFITNYPFSKRPFYHMKDETGLGTKSFDLLWKGLEITTGAQREHRLNVLEQQALEKGLSLESVKFYLDFFRYGMPPHGGLGFGLTRMLMLLLGLKNVREVTYLYRGPNRLAP